MNRYGTPQNPYRPGGYPFGETPPGLRPDPSRRPVRRSANTVCGCLILVVALLNLSRRVLMNGLQHLLTSNTIADLYQYIHYLVDILSFLLAFGLPCLMIVMLTGAPPRAAFPWKRVKASFVLPALFVCLGVSVVGTFTSRVLASWLYSIFGIIPQMSSYVIPTSPGAFALYVFAVAVMPAFFEEMLFRGAVMQTLRRFGDGFALMISSLLFAMMHGNLVQGPNALITGLAIGYFVLRSGSLRTGMIIHLANNMLVILTELVSRFLSADQRAYLSLFMTAAYLLLGGIGLVWLLLRHTNMFQLAPSDYPLRAGSKYFLFFTSGMAMLFMLLVCVLVALSLKPA